MPADFQVVDQYHGDPLYAELHVLTRDYPLARSMLKTAQFEETKIAVDTLPSTAFAWEDARRFPIHTREDTLASIFYRTKCAFHVPSEVDEKLMQAAKIYGIRRTVFSPLQKTASAADVVYALPEEKRLPLQTVEQIKIAEEVLHRDYRCLPLEKQASAFQRLYQAARRYQISVKPLTLKMAGMTGSDSEFIREWLEARATLAHKKGESSCAEGYEKLASAVSAVGTRGRYLQERPALVKLAATIAELDAQAGFTHNYGTKLPDPLLTVFNRDKLAEDVCDVAGVSVPISTLMSLPPQVWDQVDAPEIARVAAQGNPVAFAQVFDTLPADIKLALRDTVAAYG